MRNMKCDVMPLTFLSVRTQPH